MNNFIFLLYVCPHAGVQLQYVLADKPNYIAKIGRRRSNKFKHTAINGFSFVCAFPLTCLG